MATITLKGNPCRTEGNLPKVGEKAPDFQLAKNDLSEVSLKNFTGKKIVLNIFPSIDTPVCAASVKKFNEKAAGLQNTVVLSVSKDLPFALKRFCAAEGIEKVIPVSAFRDDSFGKGYGVTITDGPLRGIFARAVVVVDEKGTVSHAELIPEIGQEPDYDAALKALS